MDFFYKKSHLPRDSRWEELATVVVDCGLEDMTDHSNSKEEIQRGRSLDMADEMGVPTGDGEGGLYLHNDQIKPFKCGG